MGKLDVVSFLVKNGFIWGPEPEIYGGSAGFYSFGPLGKLLKNNVENELRKLFIKNGFWEVECPTIMPRAVWEASGHYEGFTDNVVRCSKCGKPARIDKLIEANSNKVASSMTGKEMLDFLQDEKIKCLLCRSDFVYSIEKVNLMMETTLGLDEQAFCRPETATTTYLPFNRYYDFFRKKLPLKVFQIGKAYRNEISPRQNVLRGREFTQAEAQVFINPELERDFEEFDAVKNEVMPLWYWQVQKKDEDVRMVSVKDALKKGYIKKEAYAWCVYLAYKLLKNLGVGDDKIRYRQHFPDERAHYADDAWDLEVKTNTFGWVEVCGVHDRTDYDLKRHSEHSGKSLISEDKRTPHILEIAFGPDRLVFCMVDLFVKEEKERVVLNLKPSVAPIKVSVFPLVNKDGLPEVAKGIYDSLLDAGFVASFDRTGSIGRMYRRMDEKGTPYCVTIDFNTLKDNTVTLRDRDSMKQVRVDKDDLVGIVRSLVDGKIEFKTAGKTIK